MSIIEQIQAQIRDVPDFPKPGIMFKDITPLLKNAALCRTVADMMLRPYSAVKIDAIAGIESRGFILGMLMADIAGLPFIPIRKKGKLPYHTISEKYALEYGEAEIEMHTDAIAKGQNILIHDDVLATGGTAVAACKLVQKAGGNVIGASFIIELGFLEGRQKLASIGVDVYSVVNYPA